MTFEQWIGWLNFWSGIVMIGVLLGCLAAVLVDIESE